VYTSIFQKMKFPLSFTEGRIHWAERNLAVLLGSDAIEV
jgi:hypothetical protein